MDLIKNNWGFWLIAVACFIGIIGAGVFCSIAASGLDKEMAETTKQMTDLESVKNKNLKLCQENIDIAEKNKEITEAGVSKMRQELSQRFRLEYSVPETSIEALRTLKDEIAKMRTMLEENGLEYSQKCEFFTFDSIAKATQPPNKDDLDSIFRHLAAIKVVLDTIVKAKIDYLEDLARPMGILEQDEGSYKFLPIEMTIIAKPAAAQNLINLMSRADKNLFFFRYFELVADDKTTDVGKDIRDTAFSGAGSSYSAGGGGMDGEAMGGGRSSGRRGRRGNRDEGDPGMGMEAGGNDANRSGLVEIPQKRQELLVYEPKTTKWVLRFDMILFNREEEKSEESTEESAD